MFCFVSVPSASKFKKLFSRENFLKIQIMDLNFECRAVCDFPIPTHDRWSLVFSLAIHHTSFREFFFLAEKEKHVGFWGLSKKVWRAHKLLIGFQWFSRHKFFCKFKVASLTILTGCVVTTHPEKDFLKIDW